MKSGSHLIQLLKLLLISISVLHNIKTDLKLKDLVYTYMLSMEHKFKLSTEVIQVKVTSSNSNTNSNPPTLC